MAEVLDIDEAIMSKILHYHIGDFTIDRLVKYLMLLHPAAGIKIEIAS